MPPRTELRSGSLAAILLDAAAAPSHRRRTSTVIERDGIAGIVLGPARRKASFLAAGIFVASALHAGLAMATARWSRNRAVPVHAVTAPLEVEHIVDLEQPAPEPPPSVPPPEQPAPPIAEPVRRPSATRAPSPSPPAPAAAGQVVAAEPEAAAAIDFTGFDIATGQGQEYVGGVTASSGTNTSAVHANADRDGRPGASGGTGSRARAVGLPSSDWSCPWPREADALSIDEETVVLRVVVRPDGTVASAALISDPGHGFGAVAVACARARRFRPATDDAGNAVTSTSPPVRVRFTRSAR